MAPTTAACVVLKDVRRQLERRVCRAELHFASDHARAKRLHNMHTNKAALAEGTL